MILMDEIKLGIIGYLDLMDMFDIFEDELVSKYYMLPELDSDADRYYLFKHFIVLSLDKKRYVRAIRFNDRLIGFINDVGCANGSIELGIALSSRYHGKGYGTRAFKMAIAELFNMGYKEVIAGCFVENEVSRRMMEKCGMNRSDISEEIEYRGIVHEAIFFKIENALSVSCE